jgi:putative zinc ribbon protein
MTDIKEREASRKFQATGDREYMKEFTEGREAPDCESCGFTIRRPRDHGTAADGAEIDQYCAVCYRDGAFVHDATDIPDFLTKATPDLVKHWGGSVGKTKLTLKKQLPKLPRWQ